MASLPRVQRAVAPVPNPQASLPGAAPSMLAIAAAVTTTWRKLGTKTAVPRPIRSVCSATRANDTQMSR